MHDVKEGRMVITECKKQTCYRGTSVINNSTMCKERYNASFFFVQEKLLSGEAPDARYEGAWNSHMARQKYWGSEFRETSIGRHSNTRVGLSVQGKVASRGMRS